MGSQTHGGATGAAREGGGALPASGPCLVPTAFIWLFLSCGLKNKPANVREVCTEFSEPLLLGYQSPGEGPGHAWVTAGELEIPEAWDWNWHLKSA